jgi:hypothetical protein
MPRKSNCIDLNIGVQCLDNWQSHHAIRELIANALDEHTLKRISKPITVTHTRNHLEIIDYGSGITKSNFMLQTNPTKLNNDKIIGQFGFGLKDALAVLCRNELDVTIYTKDYIYTPSYTQRQSTTDITLHITFDKNDDYDEDEDEYDYGTKIIIGKIKKSDVDKAKEYFMNYTTIKFDKLYSNEITKFAGKTQFIFVNEFRVSKTNLKTHFSYNIKKTKELMKQFNRDRSEQDYKIFKKYITNLLQDINLFDDSYASDKLCKEIQNIFESKDLREFKQIDIIRNILSQYNKTDGFIFVDVQDKNLVKKKKYQEKIKKSGRKIMYIGEGVLKKINERRPDKIKNIKELHSLMGLFTLSSPSMFQPDPIEPFVTKIKELITTIKDVLDIQISKKVEKTLTTIDLIDDDEDDEIVEDNNNTDKINNESENESENESDNESENENEDKDKDEDKDEDEENNKDYWFENGTFKIKKSIIQDDTKKNELKAVVFDYILKNIKPSDTIIILEKLLINKKDNQSNQSNQPNQPNQPKEPNQPKSWFNFF